MTYLSKLLAVMVVGVATLIPTTSTSQAIPPCAPDEIFNELLWDNFRESLTHFGFTGESIMKLFANTHTGTWTIAETSPQHITCVVMAGTDLYTAPPPLGQFERTSQ